MQHKNKPIPICVDCKEIQRVNPKGNQSWIFIGMTGVEAETPILWPPDVKNWLIWKDPDAGKVRRQEEKWMTEDEMVGWHHLLDGHEFEQALGVGNGQGSLVCCSPWYHKESDTTDWTKYLGWENRNIVAQRISQVQPRRWWQGELARPSGPCSLKVVTS